MALVQHPPLTAFLQHLETDVAPGTRNEFLSALGKKLVLAHIIPEEDFTKTGTPSDADLGGLLHKLHALGPAIDWTAINTAHPDAITFFATAGEEAMTMVKTTMLMRAQALGSGTQHAEVELRQMLDYQEVQQSVASPEMQVWTEMLSARNLQGAQAMLTTGSIFAKNLRRASLYAAVGTAKVVPKSEPCRASLNDSIKKFDALAGEHTRLAVLRCLPGEADLLAPAIDETRKTLLGFSTATSEESVQLMVKAAGMLLAEPRVADTLKWGMAKVQLALRAVTTILETMIGPCMGLGCPDRANAMIQEWAVWDDQFTHWQKIFSTPDNISPPWHFAKLIILTPIAKWLGKVWLHWCGPTEHPGSLADWLSEARLMSQPHHNLMSQEITKLRLRHARRSTAREATSESEEESDQDSGHTGDDNPDSEDDQNANGGSSPGGSAKAGRGRGQGSGRGNNGGSGRGKNTGRGKRKRNGGQKKKKK